MRSERTAHPLCIRRITSKHTRTAAAEAPASTTTYLAPFRQHHRHHFHHRCLPANARVSRWIFSATARGKSNLAWSHAYLAAEEAAPSCKARVDAGRACQLCTYRRFFRSRRLNRHRLLVLGFFFIILNPSLFLIIVIVDEVACIFIVVFNVLIRPDCATDGYGSAPEPPCKNPGFRTRGMRYLPPLFTRSSSTPFAPSINLATVRCLDGV